MPIAIVSGCGGLIGSEAARYFHQQGFDVIGLDNDMRAQFFGPESSTAHVALGLMEDLGIRVLDVDIRERGSIEGLWALYGKQIELVVHTAAQPAHDWAARDPHTDFSVNANGTLNLLQATRDNCPDASFIFCSTSKIYGDHPNSLPLVENETRLDLPLDHDYYRGIPTTMSIDHCTHSLFGVSKAAADLMVQEYGRYFDMPTACFRGGCLTGPAHAGTELHAFLAYLMKCTVTGQPYTVFGYGGKQVRDNIHSYDVVRAFAAFHDDARASAVYNLGGGRENSVSMLEAIALCEKISGRQLNWTLSDQARIGDHRWYISDLDAFKSDYDGWELTYGIEQILQDIYESNVERWTVRAAA